MNIYILAGPPGIGKSTSGYRFVPLGLPIIDHDLAAYHYRKEGFADYQHLATLKSNQQIREYLFSNRDFALELNLGFQSHYDYLYSIAQFDPSNHIHLILFYTDSLDLCMLRAKIRHKNGGHLVKPEVVREMYDNTIPLLKKHLAIFHSLRFVDSSDAAIREVFGEDLPTWLRTSGLLPTNWSWPSSKL